ncbi:LysR family transcriptional regulator [Aliiruegeria sabulilitoris]|uniref:LysR family transcriptional regulator n=1 Tax=Aliiruegeria sabulilitoris TaxID=1510458 RepID=UPI00082D8875|nr:LysR family transcriptional regulator [Aliiruegeria sabulilitoris]NDR59206.1 LysR family transcriptional regulator [Pseudoruegeria sp. M32A2M]
MHRLNALTFKQLRALRAVTDLRSISRAAEELGLTPPAVHSQLKALEENFTCAMLHRTGPEAFAPTPEGAALLVAFDKAEASLRQAVYMIEALRSGKAGTVVLGVVSTAKYFAPELVAQLKRELPEVDVKLKVGNRGEILSGLEDRAFDLALMGRPPRNPPVSATVIGPNPHLLVAAADHPLAGRESVSAEEILAEPFLAREYGSGTRVLSERFLYGLDAGDPAEVIEMSSNETIKQSVIAGLGIAILSQHTITEELHSGRLVALRTPNMPILRKWFLLYPADRPPSGAAGEVHDRILALVEPIFARTLS